MDKLKEEKEREIQELVAQLDAVKTEADHYRLAFEKA